MKYLTLLFISLLSLTACQTAEKFFKPSNYYYQSNNNQETSAHLVIPPDLTQPNFTPDPVKQVVGNKVGQKSRLLVKPEGMRIIRSGDYRYLMVDQSAKVIWNLTQNFLRQSGFAIEKSQENIGVLETNYLRRQINIPKKELNFIRSYLQKSLKANYVEPVLDKYLVRFEMNSATQTEVYLSINTIEEFNEQSTDTDSQNTKWQLRNRDENQEAIMLYRLMAYFAGTEAQEEIALAKTKQKSLISTKTIAIQIEVIKTDKFVSLKLTLNKDQAWRHIGWALDRLSIKIEDKDRQEGSYYIRLGKSQGKQGILAKLLSRIAQPQTFQLLIQQSDYQHSDVSLNLLSTDSEAMSLEFQQDFLKQIASQLNQ